MDKKLNPERVLFAGCGNMGSAILAGALDQKVLSPAQVTERFDSERVIDFKSKGVTLVKEIGNLHGKFDVIVLGVKPQDSIVIMDSLSSSLVDSGLLVSVMAGINITQMLTSFPTAAVVRAMPNTPTSIGQGCTGLTANKTTKDEQLLWSYDLFNSLGEVVIVEGEGLIDSVTAVSGSGPAYLFYLAEAMEEQAMALGFKHENARKLVIQTLKGSALLLEQSGEPPSDLRAKVTSKGGTTDAATSEFDVQGVKEGIKAGIQKAFDRSKELGE